MENNIQKYELTQNDRIYILSTHVEGDYVILKCIETSVSNPPTFIGNFSLTQLRKLSTIFNNISTAIEAQELLNQAIEIQKVSIEPLGDILNIILYLSKETESEDYTIKIGLNCLDTIYNKPLIYHSFKQGQASPTRTLPTKVISTKTESIGKTIYSPVKRLPDTIVNLPAKETITSQEIVNTTNENTDSLNYESFQNYENIQNSQNFQNIRNNEIYQNSNIFNLDNNTQIETSKYNEIVNPVESSFVSSTEQIYQINNQNQNKSQDYNHNFNDYQINNTQMKTQYQEYDPKINNNLPFITPVEEEHYISQHSPKREKIQYIIPETSSTCKFIYSLAPSHKNNDYLEQQKIIETTKTTTQHYNPIQQISNINIYNKKVNDLQNETNIIRKDYESMKNEANKLGCEIEGLKRQIDVIEEENKALRDKNAFMPNEAQIHDITILKKENESLRKQIDKYIAEQSNFDRYKKLKEEEVKYLKLQLEELLKNVKNLEEILSAKQKIIDELKLQNQSYKNNINSSENEALLMKNTKYFTEGMKNQSLTIQDTHLEIVKGDIIKSSEELEFLTRKICKQSKKITLDLLYKATIDGDKASSFHNKCDWASKTLVLIKSGKGKRFGGYTTCSWRDDSIEKKDENAFVFSLDKMKIYDIIHGEDAIGCYPRYGPIFLGCQIRVFDDFFIKGGTTFEKGMNYNTQEDYELSGGYKQFDIKEIGVYSVQLE